VAAAAAVEIEARAEPVADPFGLLELFQASLEEPFLLVRQTAEEPAGARIPGPYPRVLVAGAGSAAGSRMETLRESEQQQRGQEH